MCLGNGYTHFIKACFRNNFVKKSQNYCPLLHMWPYSDCCCRQTVLPHWMEVGWGAHILVCVRGIILPTGNIPRYKLLFCPALYQRYDLCIPWNETARPHSQFRVYLCAIYSTVYIPRIICRFGCSKIGRPRLGIYKSLRLILEIWRQNIIILFCK